MQIHRMMLWSVSKDNSRAYKVIALAVFVLALMLRCYALNAPLLDYHSWRQADTAAIARNYALNGFQLLYPQVDWGGSTPGYVESEFPLYSYTLALLYGAFGVHEWLGRLMSAIASAATAAALFGLVRELRGPHATQTGLFAGVALALMPFPIYFGRTVMPDSWMLLTATLAIWTFVRWIYLPSPSRFGVALLCGMLAPLAKTPNLLMLLPPLAYTVLVAWRNGQLRTPRLLMALVVYGLCVALPVLLWMRHAQGLPLDPRLSFGIGEKLFDTTLLRDPQFYLLLFHWCVSHVLTWIGLPLLVLGLLPFSKPQPQSAPRLDFALLPHLWLLGVLMFFLVGAAGVVGQDYYVLPLAVPAAWLIGIGLVRLFGVAPRYMPRAWVAPLLPLGALLVLAVLSILHIRPFYQTVDFYRTLGQRIDIALPPDERVGLIAPAVSEILYYAERKGWRLDPGVVVPGGLASLKPDLGIRYVLIADPALSDGRDVLLAAMREFRRIPVGPYALLFDLNVLGTSEPFEMVWETGHTLEEPFLAHWQAVGGAEQLGIPISDALRLPEGRVQLFERAMLRDANGVVERLPVGRLLLEARGIAPQPTDVDPALAEVWREAGGEALLGAPLSPMFTNARGAQIQYFEYGVLEGQRGGGAWLGGAGRQLAEERGLSEEWQIEQLRGW